jgi:hypothetical protein
MIFSQPLTRPKRSRVYILVKDLQTIRILASKLLTRNLRGIFILMRVVDSWSPTANSNYWTVVPYCKNLNFATRITSLSPTSCLSIMAKMMVQGAKLLTRKISNLLNTTTRSHLYPHASLTAHLFIRIHKMETTIAYSCFRVLFL